MESERVRRRIRLFQVSLVWLGVLAAVFCFFPAVDGQAGKSLPVPFSIWHRKPELAIVFSGQMHGYINPCGCSYPQMGGLPRRYNFFKSLWDTGCPVVAIDLGEIAETHGLQAMDKYVTSMKALDLMRYDAFGIGLNEMNVPLFQALARFAVDDAQSRTIATNLIGPKGQERIFADMKVRPFRIVDRANLPVGVYNVVGARIQQKKTDDDCNFLPAAQTLAKVMSEVNADPKIKIKPFLNIVLYQGTDDGAEVFIKSFDQLRLANPRIPHVHVVLCLSESSEPPAPKVVNSTSIYAVGHKGRYVGVLGLFKGANNFTYKFELVPIGPQYDAPPNNPVMALLEKYTQKVKDEDYLGRYPRTPHPLQARYKDLGLKAPLTYVGSDACKHCHEKEYAIWSKSKHANAFQKLVAAKNPGLRQFDGECVVCHVVGLRHTSGYPDPKAAAAGIDLTGVGCESCHGPGSGHADAEDKKIVNKKLREAMNPYSTRQDRIPAKFLGNPLLTAAYLKQQHSASNDFCTRCHDVDNDVHWEFSKSWPKIEHNRNKVAPPTAPKIGPAGASPLAPAPGGIKIEPAGK